MDPVTHFLTGATLARTGFNRKAAYATLAMTLAAETPDLDVFWGVRGPLAAFQHHRGISHTFIGLPFEGLVVLGAVYLIHRIRLRRHTAGSHPLTVAPIRWPLLYGFILIALLSHLLLDWTNNYGLRPFYPFNPHWYALSIVFIIEPVILVLLLTALLAPPLFGLIAGEVGVRRTPFRGRGWAIFALVGIVVLWGVRYTEHADALQLAAVAPYGPAGAPVPPDQVLRVFASPEPINPFLWHTVAETPAFYQLGSADTRRSVFDTGPAHDLFYKSTINPAIAVAKSTRLGQVYLDWSSWPLITDLGPNPPPGTTPSAAPNAPPVPTEVLFRDLRFLDSAGLGDSSRSNPPLSARAFVDLTPPAGPGLVAAYIGNSRVGLTSVK